MIEAKEVHGPWNEMIDMTPYDDTEGARAICMYLEAVIEAQNETNRLLALLINK